MLVWWWSVPVCDEFHLVMLKITNNPARITCNWRPQPENITVVVRQLLAGIKLLSSL